MKPCRVQGETLLAAGPSALLAGLRTLTSKCRHATICHKRGKCSVDGAIAPILRSAVRLGALSAGFG